MTNRTIIEDIKASANIVDIIGRYIKLKKKGANYFGLCPFHNDTHPSLSVSPSKKIFKCFVCQTSGDVISFVAKKENITYLEAARKVAEMINYDLSKFDNTNSLLTKQYNEKQLRLLDALSRTNLFFCGFLSNKYPEALAYANKRNLSEDIIEHFNIGYAPNDDETITKFLTNKDKFLGADLPHEKWFNESELVQAGVLTKDLKPFLKNRITFPICDANGKIIGFSGRDISNNSSAKYLHNISTEVFEKSKILYNFHAINKQGVKKLILVEGFMDAIAYWRNGYTDVIATMGTALTEGQIDLLKTLPKLETIILSFDNDDAGIDAIINNGKLLIENGFNVTAVNYKNYKEKDVDEIFNKFNKQGIDDIVNNRTDFLEFYIEKNLSSNLAVDDKQVKTTEILEYAAANATTLQVSKYVSLIASLTGYNEKDIQNTFEELRQKEYRKNQVDISSKEYHHTTSTKKSISLKSEDKNEHDTIDISDSFTIDQTQKTLALKKQNEKIISKLIFYSFTYPENIRLLHAKLPLSSCGYNVLFDNLIKVLYFVNIKNKELKEKNLYDAVNNLLDERSKKPNQEQINLKSKELLKTIIDDYNDEAFKNSKENKLNIQSKIIELIELVNINAAKINKLSKSMYKNLKQLTKKDK